jgi:hypothetical protein
MEPRAPLVKFLPASLAFELVGANLLNSHPALNLKHASFLFDFLAQSVEHSGECTRRNGQAERRHTPPCPCAAKRR